MRVRTKTNAEVEKWMEERKEGMLGLKVMYRKDRVRGRERMREAEWVFDQDMLTSP